MARIRSVKPAFWEDRKLAKATSRDARLLYIGLWNLSDEFSRCNGDPEFLRGQLFAYDDDLTAEQVGGWVKELIMAKRIFIYWVAGDPYLFLPKLAEHQRLDPSTISRYPSPDESEAPEAPKAPPEPVFERESQLSPDKSVPAADKSAEISASLCSGVGLLVDGCGLVVSAEVSPQKKTRQRDHLWDALLATCGIDQSQLTPTARGAANKATAELRAVNADPEDVSRRAAVYRLRFKDAALTPTALARHWAECDQWTPPVTRGQQRVAAALVLADHYRQEGL